jgi:hypothetical protein
MTTPVDENQIASPAPASADAEAAAPLEPSIEAADTPESAGASDAAPTTPAVAALLTTTAATALVCLDPTPAVVLLPATNEELIASGFEKVRWLLRRTHEDVVEIGCELIRLKEEEVPHGKWVETLKAELGMSQPTAHRFMCVAKKLGRSFPGNAFEKHALYLLAGEDVSDDTIKEAKALAVEKTESGQKVTTDNVIKLVDERRKASARPGGSSRPRGRPGGSSRPRGRPGGSGGEANAAKPKERELDFSGVPKLAATVADEVTSWAKRLEGHKHKASAIAIAEADGVLAAEMLQLIKQLRAAAA